MYNKGKDNSNTISIQNNEEQTAIVEVDQISDISVNINNTQINEPESNENNKYEESEIVNQDIELEDVINKANELELKCTVFQLVEKDRQSPSLWVQYNQNYPQMYRKPTPHYQTGEGYGGAPLDYDPQSRNYFVKYVFVLLFVMLLITAVFGILVLTVDDLRDFYTDSGFLVMIASGIVLIAMSYVMTCSGCSRVPPCNFISLLVVVIAMSNLVAAITVRYKTNILVLALIATVITVFVCILLACSSFDFTAWYIYVVVVAVVFMAISMVVSITMLAMGIRIKPLQIVLLFIGTLIQVVILIMELQMILGGRNIEMGEEDYALAAYFLYTSIVDIFLKIVQMMGLLDDD